MLPVSVLYVEDEPVIRQIMVRMLNRRVSTVYQAENGREGLDLFKQYGPDIVISDIRMPVMDGIQMSREIKLLDRNSRIILTTAHADEGYLLNSIEAGIDKYILKPVDVNVLFTALEKLTETIMLERKIQEQNREKDELIVKLQDALDTVKKLSGMLPICSNCKKIRDDKGYWSTIETYIAEHSDAVFTHSICDECVKKLYPEHAEKILGKKDGLKK